MDKYIKPTYLISQVAQLLNVHPQTLRQYDREGLVCPARTDGKIRLYSQKDIDDLTDILVLTRKMSVNLAGVEIIIGLKKEILNLKQELDIYKTKLSEVSSDIVVPNSKALVVKQKIYNIVVCDDR